MADEVIHGSYVQQERARESKRYLRSIPQNELDFQMRTVETVWGSKSVSEPLKNVVEKKIYYYDKEGKALRDSNGNIYYDIRDLFASLDIFNQDFRLGNLSVWNNELDVCVYHAELAHDLMHELFPEPSAVCLSRIASRTELSHSKNGFFRQIMNTFIKKEHLTQEEQPAKKNFFGVGKNNDKQQ
jgi:hypothetical protein